MSIKSTNNNVVFVSILSWNYPHHTCISFNAPNFWSTPKYFQGSYSQPTCLRLVTFRYIAMSCILKSKKYVIQAEIFDELSNPYAYTVCAMTCDISGDYTLYSTSSIVPCSSIVSWWSQTEDIKICGRGTH